MQFRAVRVVAALAGAIGVYAGATGDASAQTANPDPAVQELQRKLDQSLQRIDELSRRVPCLCKVAPNGSYHVEDVHRAGGIYTILGELDRAGLLNHTVHTVHGAPLSAWDLRSPSVLPEAVEL